jgi:hypothetical protein
MRDFASKIEAEIDETLSQYLQGVVKRHHHKKYGRVTQIYNNIICV